MLPSALTLNFTPFPPAWCELNTTSYLFKLFIWYCLSISSFISLLRIRSIIMCVFKWCFRSSTVMPAWGSSKLTGFGVSVSTSCSFLYIPLVETDMFEYFEILRSKSPLRVVCLIKLILSETDNKLSWLFFFLIQGEREVLVASLPKLCSILNVSSSFLGRYRLRLVFDIDVPEGLSGVLLAKECKNMATFFTFCLTLAPV